MTASARLSRRTVLRSVAAAAAGGVGTAGCTTDSSAIEVVVVWSSEELDLFQQVVNAYPHGRVNVISAGDDIDAVLRARHVAGNDPDVAIPSRPGLIMDYAAEEWLEQLDDLTPAYVSSNLAELLEHQNHRYGAWVKMAHKSLGWYLPPLPRGVTKPTDWPELVRTVKDLGERAQRGVGPAPLAIGAADGWVLTDWFENVLAGLSPDTYDALARHPRRWRDCMVAVTLRRLAELWSIPGAFPAGGRRALLTQYEQAVLQVVNKEAVMVFGADFLGRVGAGFRPTHQGPLNWFPFPGTRGGPGGSVVIGGDAVVAFRGSRSGKELIRWLLAEERFGPWIATGGYLSPRKAQPDNYPPDQKCLATNISESREVRFDLSDQLARPFTGADGVGIWRIMQDFFERVTDLGRDGTGPPDGESIQSVVRQTVDELVTGATRTRAANAGATAPRRR